MTDLRQLTSKPKSWCWTIMAASGSNEPEFPEQFHFEYGGRKGEESYDGENLLVKDIKTLQAIYQDCEEILLRKYNYKCDRQRYHNTNSPKNFARRLPEVNTCILRIAWSVTCWNYRHIQIAQTLAELFNKHIYGITEYQPSEQLKKELTRKAIGFTDYIL